MRIMISAGGTGGGVYPALSAAEALRKLYPDLTLTFVGARGDMARDLVGRADVKFDSYHEVLSGPLHGVSRPQQAISALKIAVGIVQSLILVLRLRPEALLLTGGWVGFPVAVACWLLRCPVVIYVPDIEPGLALKMMGHTFARVIAATVAETGQFFPGQRVVETGYPLRQEVRSANREQLRGVDVVLPAVGSALHHGHVERDPVLPEVVEAEEQVIRAVYCPAAKRQEPLSALDDGVVVELLDDQQPARPERARHVGEGRDQVR